MKRTILIHIPKTAGISIWCVARRMAQEPYRIATTRLSQIVHGTLEDLAGPNVDFLSLDHRSPGGLVDCGFISQDYFESSYRFAFVRNTWDRLVSLYEWYQNRFIVRKVRPGPKKVWLSESNKFLTSFPVFIREITTSGSVWVRPVGLKQITYHFDHANSQIEWLKWGVDFIGRFENLDEDWKKLCGIIGMKHVPLRRLNSTVRKPYREYYDRELRERVARFYAEEIERFKFSF